MTHTETAPPGVQHIRLAKLHESPTNRRRTWGDMKELTESVAKVGILQPLLARPNADGYELVFGHRRYRAAKAAKLEMVPVMVRVLSDQDSLEAQVIENVNRQDVHALEEAEWYELLRDKHKLSADDIAAKVGKSRSYVFARMKLLALAPELRKAFYEEKFSASVALYLARIPHAKLQVEALKEMSRYGGSEPPSAREAFRIIESRYMLRLADAPFDRADAALVPKAGACQSCPKRTGNQKELFADVKSPDVCTDPVCFGAKKEAAAKRRLAEAAEKGATVLEGKKVEKLFPYSGSSLAHDAPFVDLEAKCYDDSKGRTFKQLLKGAELPLTVAKDSQGQVHELVEKKELAKALRAAGVKAAKANTVGKGEGNADAKKRREAAKRKRAVTLAVVGAVVEAAEKKEPTKAFWPFLAGMLIAGAGHEACVEILKRRDLFEPKKQGSYPDRSKELANALGSLSETEARGLAIELALSPDTFSFGDWAGDGLGKHLLAAAEFYRVDVGKVGAKAREELKAAAEKKKSAGKGTPGTCRDGGP